MATKNVKAANNAAAEEVQVTESFFNKNKKLIFGIIIAIIVIIVGGFLVKQYILEPREDKASTALATAQDLFAQGQYDKAAPEFQKVISDYGHTDASNLANLYLGLCYAHQQKWQDAVKYLEEYSSASDAMVSPTAEAALGNAYANVGQIDKAVSSLKKAAEMADAQSINDANYSISATFLIQAGQLLESQNKNDEALQLYKDIKAKYVNAAQVQRKDIDKYIERLEEK